MSLAKPSLANAGEGIRCVNARWQQRGAGAECVTVPKCVSQSEGAIYNNSSNPYERSGKFLYPLFPITKVCIYLLV